MELNKKTRKRSWREIHEETKERKEKKFINQIVKAEKEEQEVKPKDDFTAKDLPTWSIAVPGSIVANAQTPELRAYLASQVARAACIYRVSEIIVFDDKCNAPPPVIEVHEVSKDRKFCIQFARLLQYLECPQYLRKYYFPIHDDLKYAGVMNPLDAPHHMRQDENSLFREGITTDKQVKNGQGTYVYVGLHKEVLVDKSLKPGLRVTVELNEQNETTKKKLRGKIVPPDKAVKVMNTYWGYSVRIADSLSSVFTKSPFPQGYDLTIGTSERGKVVDSVKKKEFKDFKHALIVFGGLDGLESALECDDIEVDNVALLFDHYINTCPTQGSRTIRTEEAILITLAELRKKMWS